MRRAGRVVREVLELVRGQVQARAPLLSISRRRQTKAHQPNSAPSRPSRGITGIRACYALRSTARSCTAFHPRSGS